MKRTATAPLCSGVTAAVCILLALISANAAFAQRRLIEPEAATGWMGGTAQHASRHMISTANAIASQAGREILRQGGSAVDAAIAAQLVLGLVEPQSSGLGGGAFVLHWDDAGRELRTYDGRETAPAAAKPDRFLRNGSPIPFDTAVHSGLSIGTPGLVRLLEAIHRAHGKLDWARLFEPAIALAAGGFPVSPRLSFMLRWRGADSFDAAARAYFFDENGQARPVGYPLKNPAYAATLRALATHGADAFYTGDIARQIVEATEKAPNFAGDLAARDLRSYAVVERPPVCVPYRSYRVCGMGPPSSGGIAIAQILTMLAGFNLGSAPHEKMNPTALHVIVEAQKLAYADRARYLADPAFVPVPSGLTDRTYLEQRRALIDPNAAMAAPEPGLPPGLDQRSFGDDTTLEQPGTSHISRIDGAGNAVAMTTTIEGAFGSGVMAAGFLLNNELTDFSFRPTDSAGRPAANRVEAGKRPRSTMAPTIVFDANGKVFAVLGSPGGGRIIYFVTKALVALLDWRLDAYEATSLTNFGSMGVGVEIEYDWKTVLIGLELKKRGHKIRPDLMNSGLNILIRRANGIEGASDPRREGAALGD